MLIETVKNLIMSYNMPHHFLFFVHLCLKNKIVYRYLGIHKNIKYFVHNISGKLYQSYVVAIPYPSIHTYKLFCCKTECSLSHDL